MQIEYMEVRDGHVVIEAPTPEATAPRGDRVSPANGSTIHFTKSVLEPLPAATVQGSEIA
ncbi:hypothetical protein ACIGXM_16005 [Kitasatospora sp. NPDC052896]|uniref:hypothetical protein n=1 Tax=Kitasatospora sp. NPDC052896 TaxID=3364061 RepID=UPI0037CB45D0